jgi:hypothetical protein
VADVVTEENNFLLMRERDSELLIRISGTWRLRDGLPSMDAIKKEIERSPHPRLVLFNTQELAGWDSSVVWFLTKVSELSRESDIAVDRDKLPKGLRRLVELAEARATLRVQDRARRGALYGEFIREASKLFADAFEHELDDPAKLVRLYAIVSTVRLFGQPQTLKAAERVMNQIGAAILRRTGNYGYSPT